MSYRSQTQIQNDRDFDTTYTNSFDSDQTTTIITPTSGKLLKVVGATISCDQGASSGSVKLRFVTSNDTVVEIFPDNNGGTNSVEMIIRGAVNEALTLISTIGVDANFFVSVNYKEE